MDETGILPAAKPDPIFETACTAWDPPVLREVLLQLRREFSPATRHEENLVEQMALAYLRMQRCARIEAEFHIRTWEEPDKRTMPSEFDQLKKRRRAGARAVPFRRNYFEESFEKLGLQALRLTSQYLRLSHELERAQLLRKGVAVEPPQVVDIAVAAEPPPLARPLGGA